MADYCTKATVKTIMGYAGSDKDAAIDLIIPMVTILFNRALDRDLREQVISDELYDGSGSPYIFLKQIPIKNGETFVVKVDDEVIDAADYVVYEPEGMVKLKTDRRESYRRSYPVFEIGDLNVKVSYTAGYATAPKDVELAAVLMTGHFVDSSGTIAGGLISEKIGNYSYRLANMNPDQAERDIPESMWSMISRYANRDWRTPRRT